MLEPLSFKSLNLGLILFEESAAFPFAYCTITFPLLMEVLFVVPVEVDPLVSDGVGAINIFSLDGEEVPNFPVVPEDVCFPSGSVPKIRLPLS